MRKTTLGAVWILLLLIGGCSSEKSTKDLSPDPDLTARVPPLVIQTSPDTKQPVPLADEVFVSNDSLIAFQLERARQHYLSAVAAEEAHDTLRTTMQYEQSIQILNDLSYYPDIETSQDFNDLSKSVVDDYEAYIRKTGSVDSTSSIFALREKLNMISDQVDSITAVQPKRVIPGTTIPLVVNGLVEQHISFLTNRGRIHMEHWLERSGRLFPMMKRIMAEEGVPEEIVYLAMIESGLNPLARSWAKAVGLWQFIKGTGSRYGLRGNFWYDERRDFEKATRAAARHLKDLYEDFEDWYLVMAAYNSGPGNVYRAMRRSGTNDFWEMRRFLPRETRNYVPSYISAAIIAMNPEEYGFNPPSSDEGLEYDYVTVHDCVDLEVLADCLGIEVEELSGLNPALLHRCTPPTTEGYQLRVPKSTDKDAFEKKYAEVPDSKKGYLLTHSVRRGETIPTLARRYGVSQQILAEANGVNRNSRLKRGTKLMIPIANVGSTNTRRLASSFASMDESNKKVQSSVRTQTRVVRAVSTAANDGTKLTYRVKAGDTIGHIAEWYDVRATDIRNWNNLPYGRKLRAGASLTVFVGKRDAEKYRNIDNLTFAQKTSITKKPKAEVESSTSDVAFAYIVKSGDSLDKIAQEHGASVRQVQRWNSLRSSRIVAGQKLVLYPRVESVPADRAKNVAEENAKPRSKTSDIIYVVRKGDTISEIASSYNVPVSQIRAWNSLKQRNMIYAGQELIIRKEAN